MTAILKNSMFSRNAIVFSWIPALRANPSTRNDARKESNPTTGRKTNYEQESSLYSMMGR